MKSSTAIVLLLAAFIVGYAAGALSSPIREYIPTTTTVTSSLRVTSITTVEKFTGEVVEVCFSAVMDCSSILQGYLRKANKSIYVMVYSFTQDELGDALIDAMERGVEVVVIVEEKQVSQYSEVEKLRNAGVETYLDGNPFLMHHKVAIIDDVFVITGSYNWSKSAEDRNDENLIVLRGRELATLFMNEFKRVLMEAAPA